jgi:DNA-directed RNA polymerase specialized sigma24 family protein
VPPDYRTAIVLRDVEGLSTQQAAEIVGVGEATFCRPAGHEAI